MEIVHYLLCGERETRPLITRIVASLNTGVVEVPICMNPTSRNTFRGNHFGFCVITRGAIDFTKSTSNLGRRTGLITSVDRSIGFFLTGT
jgi:hypothetical protein